MIKTDDKYMRLAIKQARMNLKSMQGGPFGACVVKGTRVLAAARNTVLKGDATAHAEMNAIRLASQKAGTYDLSGCVIYTTTEPCPMCFSAIHWAKIEAVVYATLIKDAQKIGFNELKISCGLLKTLSRSKVRLIRSGLVTQARKLFSDWKALPEKIVY